MKKYSSYTIILLASLFFLSCGNTPESSSNSEPSFVSFCKEQTKNKVPELSNGYFKYVELSVTDARGSLSEKGDEQWRVEFILKVEGEKDGGDIYLSSNNEISSLEVKTSTYSNAMTKKGEFYRIRMSAFVEKHDGKWAIVQKE